MIKSYLHVYGEDQHATEALVISITSQKLLQLLDTL